MIDTVISLEMFRWMTIRMRMSSYFRLWCEKVSVAVSHFEETLHRGNKYNISKTNENHVTEFFVQITYKIDDTDSPQLETIIGKNSSMIRRTSKHEHICAKQIEVN